ncbi:O-antigen polymerase [Pedobacter sp. B4-66]|uniref:O-antigen polymerase n=1 Tax=Pedobacter sp. B4-66 TaxID=2817280 RepID=UPI001BD9F5DE|nr:O-antigen polymerase [Pedobacter sp. B4-66]
MNTKWLTNPFFIYSLGFLLVFLVYTLRWSDKYPALSANLILFLFATFLISFFLAFILEKFKRNEFAKIDPDKNRIIVISTIYAGYFLEFAYSGGIPIILTIINPAYSYKDFTGIPTFHVILGTYGIFYSIYLFHQYVCSEEKRKAFILYIISVIPNILVINRGAVMIILIASLFIYLMAIGKVGIKKVLTIVLSLFILIYFFGIIGNIRYKASKEDKAYILRIGGASDKFIESNIPPEYYWGYLYIATPIGNMQNIVNKRQEDFNPKNIPYFIAAELLPDFISKRVISLLSLDRNLEPDRAEDFYVIRILNAPTVYYRSYYLLGWFGAWSMYIYSAMVMLFYPFIISRNSKYYITGWACLATIILLNIFSNMWATAGTILFWPILATLASKIKFRELLKKTE